MTKSGVINFHHVGARAGSLLPALCMLGDEQAIWLYDADTDCVNQVSDSSNNSPIPINARSFLSEMAQDTWISI